MFADELAVVFPDPAVPFTLKAFLTYSPRDRSPNEPTQSVSLRLVNRLAWIRMWEFPS
jgi:hypothetical protein